ncbi:hypothetical protein [Streptomyces thioluteus]
MSEFSSDFSLHTIPLWEEGEENSTCIDGGREYSVPSEEKGKGREEGRGTKEFNIRSRCDCESVVLKRALGKGL